MIHLDTHVVIWLYEGKRAPRSVLRDLAASQVFVSPIVELELATLREIGRIAPAPSEILGELRRKIGLRMSSASFVQVTALAVELGWTRDPFDRLIVASAMADGARLATFDERIRQHCSFAFWD